MDVGFQLLFISTVVSGSNILMITMSTKSHKIPFLELGQGLVARGHNITFLSPYPPDIYTPGIEEVIPLKLVFYLRNVTNRDLLGARMAGGELVALWDGIRYGFQSCEALLSDPETKELLESKKYDLLILDGAFPECALGLTHHFKSPFMYINTVGFYTGSLSIAGNPVPYSVTPFPCLPFTDNMNFVARVLNTGFHAFISVLHAFTVNIFIEGVLRSHFGSTLPNIYHMSRNVSFILQNGHFTVSYPRPYLPNVAEIGCIHCYPAKPLPKDLETFVSEEALGFIYVSMGTFIQASNMPEKLKLMLISAFSQLPYRILWKYETDDDEMPNLPHNIMLRQWFPQQDILGHRNIKAFVTPCGIHSMFETIYHAVPVVTIPVICDQDSNAAKAELDGYSVKLELRDLTVERLLWAINTVIDDPKYRENVRNKSILLRDQPESPLKRAIYWTEYVLRHDGAYHLQSPSKDYNTLQYYLVDVIAIYLILITFILLSLSALWNFSTKIYRNKKLNKIKSS